MVATAVKLASKRRRGIHIHSMLTVPDQPAARRRAARAGSRGAEQDRAGEADRRPAGDRPRRAGAARPGGLLDRRGGEADQAPRRSSSALRYRNGAPLYDKTLQTVLGERPCRVIVVSDRGVQPGAEPTPPGRAERGLESRRWPRPSGSTAAPSAPSPGLRRARPGDPRRHPGQRRRPALGRLPAGHRLRRGRRRPALGRGADGHVERAGERAAAEAPGALEAEPLLQRGLGVPWLFAAAYSAVGFSIYFSLGVVADRGLGLTPLIFLAAGLLFVPRPRSATSRAGRCSASAAAPRASPATPSTS